MNTLTSNKNIFGGQNETTYRAYYGKQSFLGPGKCSCKRSISAGRISQQKKERIVLEVIAQAFEFDRIYSEREVNIIIADFYDDFCTIRRDMVAEQLLGRNEKGYWRVASHVRFPDVLF